MTGLSIKNKYMNYFSKKRELEKYAQLGKMSHELFHDILNPISGLVLYFEMIQECKKRSPADLILLENSIVKEVNELSKSGEGIRDFIKLIQNNLLNIEEISLLETHSEIREIISLTYLKSKRNNVSITFIQKDYIQIKISKIKFFQLMTNLISNGIDSFDKNINKRKRKLIIKCEQIESQIVFSFIDNGCGIKKENINKIFKNNYSNKDSGLGIGLKTVKKIVLENKGKIQVKSSQGRGTTFKISIPNNY